MSGDHGSVPKRTRSRVPNLHTPEGNKRQAKTPRVEGEPDVKTPEPPPFHDLFQNMSKKSNVKGNDLVKLLSCIQNSVQDAMESNNRQFQILKDEITALRKENAMLLQKIAKIETKTLESSQSQPKDSKKDSEQVKPRRMSDIFLVAGEEKVERVKRDPTKFIKIKQDGEWKTPSLRTARRIQNKLVKRHTPHVYIIELNPNEIRKLHKGKKADEFDISFPPPEVSPVDEEMKVDSDSAEDEDEKVAEVNEDSEEAEITAEMMRDLSFTEWDLRKGFNSLGAIGIQYKQKDMLSLKVFANEKNQDQIGSKLQWLSENPKEAFNPLFFRCVQNIRKAKSRPSNNSVVFAGPYFGPGDSDRGAEIVSTLIKEQTNIETIGVEKMGRGRLWQIFVSTHDDVQKLADARYIQYAGRTFSLRPYEYRRRHPEYQ